MNHSPAPITPKELPWRIQDALLGATLLLLVWTLNGAIPGWLSPTLNQMLWLQGFAQSLANQGWLAIHATDFGLPEPAAIAFGLSGAWVGATYVRLGLQPVDAYAAMVATWLTVSFVGATALAQLLGVARRASMLLGGVWLSLPIVWAHADYSALGLGFALMPTYAWGALRLLIRPTRTLSAKLFAGLTHLALSVVAVFMDGYSFVMFAVGTAIIGTATCWKHIRLRSHMLRFAGPAYLVGLACAYLAYKQYIGGTSYGSHSLDFFRGWAVDLHYLLIPTQGFNALMDALGWSDHRLDSQHFGDASVWRTSYALPLMVAGSLTWLIARRHNNGAALHGLWLVAIFGLYMALGPSVKWLSTDYAQLHQLPPGNMPADAGLFETGNGWISQNIPGFDVMRASYRWTALMLLALWLIFTQWAAEQQRGTHLLPQIIIAILLLAQLPAINHLVHQKSDMREIFLTMDRDIAASLRTHTPANNSSIFLPIGNDFSVNHIAAKYQIKAFNIGGDKNVEMAYKTWPEDVKSAFTMGAHATVNQKVLSTKKLIWTQSVNTVFLPHFGHATARLQWPCESPNSLSPVGLWQREIIFSDNQPNTIKIADVADRTGRFPIFLHAPDATKPSATGPSDDHRILGVALSEIRWLTTDQTPEGIQEGLIAVWQAGQAQVSEAFDFGNGWYPSEATHRWSGEVAQLILTRPAECQNQTCHVELTLQALGASEETPRRLTLTNEPPDCPGRRRAELEPALRSLNEDPWLDVRQSELFTSIRLSDQAPLASSELRARLSELVSFPAAIGNAPGRAVETPLMLADGWFGLEPAMVWSSEHARLWLPVPPHCRGRKCAAVLTLRTLTASPGHPAQVTIRLPDSSEPLHWHPASTAPFEAHVQLPTGMHDVTLEIEVPTASSPAQLMLSNDTRTLGVALMSVDVRPMASDSTVE